MNTLKLSLALAATVALSSLARADYFTYYASLDGAQAGTPSTAAGWATLEIRTEINRVDYYIWYWGPLGAETQAHVHGPAPPFSSAPILVNLPVGTPKVGHFTYAEPLEAALLGGLFYVDVHTTSYPAGELRSQLVPDPVFACRCEWAATPPCDNDDNVAGCVNSTGSGGLLWFGGIPSVSLDLLVLHATQLPAQQSALFFMGANLIMMPFGDGFRCLGGGVQRFPIGITSTLGELEQGPGLVAHAAASFPPWMQIQPGTTWAFQCWYRDPSGPCGSGFNLTNGLRFQFTP